MIFDLKPYPAMKDSGVEWLGEVPEHWNTRPLKRWVTINAEVMPETTAPDRVFRYVDIGSVGTGTLTQKPQRLRFAGAPSRARRVVHNGDTLVSTVRTYLKAIYFVDGEADELVCSTGFAVLTPRVGTVPQFVSYLARSNAFTDRVTADSVGIAYPAVAESRLGSFHVAVPPLHEQAIIVRFLDYSDRRIQCYIRAKQKLVTLLEEQKQALIHQAVTGQIDVRTGQPYPAYKPSGVEWLREVPEHWDVRRLGALLSERGETNAEGRVTDVLSVLKDRGVIPYAEKGNIGNKKSEDITRYKIVRPNDIVVNCMNVIIGSVGLSKFTGCLSPVYYVLTRRSETDRSRYLDAYFQTRPFQRSLVRIGHGILAHRMRIPMELLKCEPFPRPPTQEQAAIVRYLDKAIADADSAVDSARRQIELLQEYRTRLIADVVTGKLDVREAAAHLPDEAEEPELLDKTDALFGGEEKPINDLDAAPEEAAV